jgi:hypothetical protein
MPRSFIRKVVGCVLAMAGALAPAGVNTIQAQPQDAFEPPRKRMVEEIAALVRDTRHETGRASLSERVIDAADRDGPDHLAAVHRRPHD